LVNGFPDKQEGGKNTKKISRVADFQDKILIGD
jgi:hypothetical protein